MPGLIVAQKKKTLQHQSCPAGPRQHKERKKTGEEDVYIGPKAAGGRDGLLPEMAPQPHEVRHETKRGLHRVRAQLPFTSAGLMTSLTCPSFSSTCTSVSRTS